MLKEFMVASLLAGALIMGSANVQAVESAEHLSIGDQDILVIPDASGSMEQSLLPGLAGHPEMQPLFANGPLPAVVRTYFLKSGDRNVLIDAGWGEAGHVRGRTLEVLQEEGIKPEDVTDILLTHMDGDHIGGLLRNGAPVFPSATLWVSRPEYEAWKSGTIDKRPQKSVELSQQVLERYGNRVKTFNFGDEILPGITAVDASGHTPGHTAYDIKTGDDKLTIAGDLIHVWQVQLPLPELSTVYDVDMDRAAQARNRLLARAAEERSTFAGMHMPLISPVLKRSEHGFMMREPR